MGDGRGRIPGSTISCSRVKPGKGESMAKNYEDLEFTDDFMFGKVMEDRELCRQKEKPKFS